MYQLQTDWFKLPQTIEGSGKSHGVYVSNIGTIIVFYQNRNGLLHISPEGEILGEFGGDQWLGAHGLTAVQENGQEYLWLTDQLSCKVKKVDLEGNLVQELPYPQHSIYQDAQYVPTWVAIHPIDGRIYLADGYGSDLIHIYDKEGSYQDCWDGSKGEGCFSQAHGIAATLVDEEVEVWITDRWNNRIQIFDEDGNFLRSSLACHSPCMFEFFEDKVIIPELFSGVKVFDLKSMNLLEEIGRDCEIVTCPPGEPW